MGLLHDIGVGLSDLPVLWKILAVTALWTAYSLMVWSQKPRIPYINSYAGDWSGKKAKQAFLERGQALLADGLHKFGGEPFRIITTLGERVILSKHYLEWTEKHPDLDHQAQVAEEFFGSYPGFEGIGAFNDPNKFLIDMVKKKMSSMTPAMLKTFFDGAYEVLNEELGEDTDFHPIAWSSVCTKLIARMSSSIFVGPRLAKDARWQKVTLSYTTNLFNACRALRAWPAPLRRIVVWLLPECKLCREQIHEARKILSEYNAHDLEGDNTAFAWVDKRADPVIIQLALAAGALHTTSQLMNQAVLDLAFAATESDEMIERLRKELDEQTDSKTADTTGRDLLVVPSTLPKLTLLEACIKETQRLKPQTLTNLDRMALKPVTLPNGVMVPTGTMISVDQGSTWSEEAWGHDALVWKPERWFETEVSTDKARFGRNKLVNSSEKHFAFGKGQFICPGRFLVNGELKVALSLLLDGWNIRLSRGDYEKAKLEGLNRVKWIPYGFEMLADESVVVEVRRRLRA